MNPTNPQTTLPPQPAQPNSITPSPAAVQPTAAPVSTALQIFAIAEVIIFIVSKLGVIALVLLIVKIFAINGGNFDNGVQAISSIIGLVALAAIYLWTTDFIIRLKAIKKLKSRSVSQFMGVYYGLSIFVIPWVISFLKPITITKDLNGNYHLSPASIIAYFLIAAVINVLVELFIYKQLNKPASVTTLPLGPPTIV